MNADSTPSRPITRLLEEARDGDAVALDRVFDAVYAELVILSRRQRGRWRGAATINTTALVHEAYLKLVGRSALEISGRGHFFALAARAMRQILSNHARDRQALKRGGGHAQITLDGQLPVAASADAADTVATLVALDRALSELEETHPRAARVVECRFFGGMTVEETATALAVSDRTVKRDWEFAQAWLRVRLEGRPA
mgnify:FL=1